jgi:AcrR family transcriptional regulator
MAAATRLFAERGYEATSTEEILAASGLTRGALYHHFADKRALFLAAALAIDEDVAARLAERTVGEVDPVRRARSALGLYLEEVSHPHRARILLLDAPAVLGPMEWHLLSTRMWRRHLRHLPLPAGAEAMAPILGAALDRAARALALSSDDAERNATRAAAFVLLDRLLDPSTSESGGQERRGGRGGRSG